VADGQLLLLLLVLMLRLGKFAAVVMAKAGCVQLLLLGEAVAGCWVGPAVVALL
jgi:hypothetical protein